MIAPSLLGDSLTFPHDPPILNQVAFYMKIHRLHKPFLFFAFALSLSPSAFGVLPEAHRVGDTAILTPTTTEPFRRGFTLGSEVRVDPRTQQANKDLFSSSKVGDHFIIQNSLSDWQDEVVRLTDKFEDGRIKVELRSGRRAFVSERNLARTLSPELSCADSLGTQICQGDRVTYPSRASSMEIPDGEVLRIFANGSVLVKDGVNFIVPLRQVGKRTECSPQKPSLCVGDYVVAEAYRLDRRFDLEGPVRAIGSDGTAYVESDGVFLFPVHVNGLRERIASLDGEVSPAVIQSRSGREKVPFRVMGEIESADDRASFQIDSGSTALPPPIEAR
jgi:hypothetical protein